MSYHEYLDIDRRTITREMTPTTLAKRYVYDAAVSEHPCRLYIGRWRPVPASCLVNGVVVHETEMETDNSLVLRHLILKRSASRVNDIQRCLHDALIRIKAELRDVDKFQRELHEAQDRASRLKRSKSLREMLAIRAERNKK